MYRDVEVVPDWGRVAGKVECMDSWLTLYQDSSVAEMAVVGIVLTCVVCEIHTVLCTVLLS